MTGPTDSLALFTDLYEITMSSVYHAEDIDDRATFELWVRELPPERNFLIVAGVNGALRYLVDLRFEPADIEYLAGLSMFDLAFLDRLSNLRFTGDAWAMPEGTVAFPAEPIMRITAPRIEAQLVETALLNAVTFETMIATKAARITIAAAGRPFADFSARRDHGAGAAVGVARAAYIGGADSTSNVLAGRLHGMPLSGTMAHSFVLSFPTELDAFRAYARHFPDGGTLLIDTFGTLAGAHNAVTVARELENAGHHLGAVRLDSGDLFADSFRVREILDAAGLPGVRIFASGDLDEFAIDAFVRKGAPIDAFGVGTRLGTSADAPSLGGVYKLVEDGHGGRAKSSPGKETLAFAKQVYRLREGTVAVSDTLAVATEAGVPGEPLLHQRMRGGVPLGTEESLDAIRRRCEQEVASLPAPLRTIRTAATPYPVLTSAALREAQETVRR